MFESISSLFIINRIYDVLTRGFWFMVVVFVLGYINVSYTLNYFISLSEVASLNSFLDVIKNIVPHFQALFFDWCLSWYYNVTWDN